MLTNEQLLPLYKKFGKEKVEEIVKYLNYKKGAVPMKKEETKGKPIIYVFRHGQTTDNANMIFSGWRDVDLTEKGIEQAEILAEKLKDKEISMLIASDQKRAVRTMEIAMSKNPYAKDLEIIKEPRIKERSYGEWQGTSKLERLLLEPDSKENRRDMDFIPPRGESIRMVEKRVFDFLEEILPHIKEHNINIAISCHGNSIRAFRQKFENLDDYETSHIETSLGQDYGAYYVGE